MVTQWDFLVKGFPKYLGAGSHLPDLYKERKFPTFRIYECMKGNPINFNQKQSYVHRFYFYIHNNDLRTNPESFMYPKL